MSRDLTDEERVRFTGLYGSGAACEKCGNTEVVVKIWEKYGAGAQNIGGDIGPTGIVGAMVTCDGCGHAEIVGRERILKAS